MSWGFWCECQPEGNCRGCFHLNLQGNVGEEKKVVAQTAGSIDICRASGEEGICAKIKKGPTDKWKGYRQDHLLSQEEGCQKVGGGAGRFFTIKLKEFNDNTQHGRRLGETSAVYPNSWV